MVKITPKRIFLEEVIEETKSKSSGCLVTYIGLIRDNSRGKKVLEVEYEDKGDAKSKLEEIISEASKIWPLNNILLVHRVGRLKVGEVNLVLCIASSHRKEGFEACQYIIDRFKEISPTFKKETYTDGTVFTSN